MRCQMRGLTPFIVLLGLGLCPTLALATTLPDGVLKFVKSVDARAAIRQDGLIKLTNGDVYLPVLPQDPTLDLNPKQIARQWLGKANQPPELVQFDNNLFLLRLAKGSRGRLMAAKLTYPIELKEGLLPQDLQLAPNMVIPAELKVILGSVAYQNKQAANAAPEPSWIDDPTPHGSPTTPLNLKPGQASNGTTPMSPQGIVLPAKQLYLADAINQQLVALNLATGAVVSKTDLGCMPSTLTPTPGGLMVLATCLNSNQLMVIDPITEHVRSQFATGQRPAAVAVVNEDTIWIANRFDPFLTVYPLVPVLKDTNDKTEDDTTLIEAAQVTLPTPTDQLLPLPNGHLVAVDSATGTAHWVNTKTRTVVKTLKTIPMVSATALMPTPGGGMRLWVASRTQAVAKAFNLTTGKEEASVPVGQKPVAMVAADKLYVLTAADNRIEVIDPQAATVVTTIPLPVGSFPGSLIWNGTQLFAASPALGQVYVINTQSYQVETTWNGKANALSFNLPMQHQPVLLQPTQNDEPVAALATQTPVNNAVLPSNGVANTTGTGVTLPTDKPPKASLWRRFFGLTPKAVANQPAKPTNPKSNFASPLQPNMQP
jgi:hypothetical protein